MGFFEKIHLFTVIGTMLTELGNWSWDSQFCVMMLVFFLVGLIPQFILLRMKWKPWVISLMLGALIIVCDFMCLFLGDAPYIFFSLIEAFFISALVGAAGAGAAHIFWELFKKKDPNEEDTRWLV